MAPRNTSLPRHNGAAIRSLRVKTGTKISAFAAEVGCTARHLNNIESERGGCSPELLVRIARRLNVPEAALLRVPSDTEDAA